MTSSEDPFSSPQPPAGAPQGWGQPQGYGPPAGYGQPQGYGPPPYGAQPGWGGSPYPPPSRPTNGMAIASLVLGILWLYWLGSILALVFGYVAKRQIRERGESGGGLATAGIVLGWIGVGFLAIALLFLIAAASSSGY